MTPTIGRIVHYTLGEGDVNAIRNQRLAANLGSYLYNQVEAGQTYPAIVVRVFGSAGANLQVLLDGVDSHWATSRTEGEGEGHWIWPPRVEAPAPAAA